MPLQVLRDGEPAGVAISAVGGKSQSAPLYALAHEAIRRPEEHLVLLGAEKAVLPLFEFSVAQAQHCRSISGSETAILAEVRGAAAGGKCRLPCLRTPPHLPPWTV